MHYHFSINLQLVEVSAIGLYDWFSSGVAEFLRTRITTDSFQAEGSLDSVQDLLMMARMAVLPISGRFFHMSKDILSAPGIELELQCSSCLSISCLLKDRLTNNMSESFASVVEAEFR